jgi:hypothetical protein
MERHFDNLEEAELFAAKMRSDGYQAEVMSESIPTLWGAAAIGDIRVIVGELTEGPDPEPVSSPAADLAGRLLYGTLIGSFLVVTGWLALEITAYLLKDGFIGAVLKVFTVLSTLYALSAWSLLLSTLFRKSREPGSRLGLIVHAFMSVVAVALCISLLIFDFRF